DRDERGSDHWREDSVDDREFRRTVEPSRLDDLVRDGNERLSYEKRAQRARGKREHKGAKCVRQRHLREHQEHADERHLCRDEETGDDEPERNPSPDEMELCERIASRQRKCQLKKANRDRHTDGDEQAASYRELREDLTVRIELRVARKRCGRI